MNEKIVAVPIGMNGHKRPLHLLPESLHPSPEDSIPTSINTKSPFDMKKTKNVKSNTTPATTALVIANTPAANNDLTPATVAAPFTSITTNLDMNLIDLNPHNPRTAIDEERLNELAESIRVLDVQSPILVMPKDDGRYQIVFGERRFKASLLAGKTTIPARIEKMTDAQAEVRAIHENIQRDNMTPFEEGQAFERLLNIRKMPIEEICATFAKSRAYVHNRLNLTKLIPSIAKLLSNKEITLEVAQVLAKYDSSIQKSTYEEHFKNSGVMSWRGFSAKEIDKKLFDTHLTKLKEYHFDKTACNTCAHNTSNNVLFSFGDGACKKMKCLTGKNIKYLTDYAKALRKQDPYIEFGFLKGEGNKAVSDNLAKLGYEVKIIENWISLKTPAIPQAPDLSKIEDKDDREILLKRFDEQVEKHKAECDKLDQAVADGKKLKIGVVREREIQIAYQDVKLKTVIQNGVTETLDPASPLAKKIEDDKRFYRVCNTNIKLDLKKEFKNPKIEISHNDNLTTLEWEALYYVLLNGLSWEYKKTLGFKNDSDKKEAYLEYVRKMTEQQKNALIRMSIMSYLSMVSSDKCEADNPDLIVMLQLGEAYFPKRTSQITKQYRTVYDKRHAAIAMDIKGIGGYPAAMQQQEENGIIEVEGLSVDPATGEILDDSIALLTAAASTSTPQIEEAEVILETEFTPETQADEPEQWIIEDEPEPNYPEEEPLSPEEINPSLMDEGQAEIVNLDMSDESEQMPQAA